MTAQPRRRRPGGRSERVGKAVIDATLAVMADKGMTDFTVNDVAARASVHPTSIYRRWGTRDNLIVETLLALSAELIPVPDTGALRSDLLTLATAVAGYLNTAVGRALAQAMAFSGEETRWATVRTTFWNTRLRLARTIIDRAIERGEVPPDTDPRLVLETLIAPMQFRTVALREPFDEELGVRLVGLVLDGILPRRAAAR